VSKEVIKETLRNFGLTEKEAEIYIFIAKYGAQTSGEIAKNTKTHRPHIYRILKSLQKKGVIESTLESPTRFIITPFERIIDENIKAKHQEAVLLEESKDNLLNDWKNISSKNIVPDVGKFFIIEGNKKIYFKICEMARQTKSQFYAILTVPELVRNEQYGVFDAIYTHPDKSKTKFQFLTELYSRNLKAIKLLTKKLKTGLDLNARNPSTSFSMLPRMVTRDNEETLFFVTPKTEVGMDGNNETCIYTNNPSLVQSLTGIFKELWRDSTEVYKRILEIETVKLPEVPILLSAAKKSKKDWLVRETIQYYLQALELMKDYKKWNKERVETLEALGGLHGLVAEHEKSNEFYQKGIESTDDALVKERLQRKIRRKKIVENEGIKLSYYVYGMGEPTLFILSWNTSTEKWIPQVTYFSQKYKVVTMDLRGTGESDKPKGDYSIDKYVDDVKCVFEDLRDNNIVFLGSFVGAKIAVKYVTSYPGKVTKLVLFGFTPSPIWIWPGIDKKKFEEEYQRSLKNPSWRIKKFWEDLVTDPKLFSLRVWGIENTKKNTSPEIFVNSLYNFQMEDVRSLLEKIDIPTLLLYGDLSISGLKAVKRLKEKVPSSETIIIRGGGKCFANLIKPNQFNRIVENFIEEEQ
jgi:pimeloyl-ACP methyl ester carboxylesterase/sugar-specific transcriptional regulator TrmB